MTNERRVKDVVFALTDPDGARRDISWPGLHAAEAVALLRWLAERYSIVSLSETQAETVPCDIDEACEALAAGRSVCGKFEQGPLELSRVQYTANRENDQAQWLVELSFAPQDLSLATGLAPFVHLIEDAKLSCGASAYLVHHEDASFNPIWQKRGYRELIFSSEEAMHLQKLAPATAT